MCNLELPPQLLVGTNPPPFFSRHRSPSDSHRLQYVSKLLVHHFTSPTLYVLLCVELLEILLPSGIRLVLSHETIFTWTDAGHLRSASRSDRITVH